jgi:alpha-N-acetylglucosaminidase
MFRLSLVATCVAAAAAAGDPIGSVTALVGRLLGPAYTSSFAFSVIPADNATGHDVFELDYSAGKPVIRGNTGVALASGFHWYLKYTLNASISWVRLETKIIGMHVLAEAAWRTPLPPFLHAGSRR